MQIELGLDTFGDTALGADGVMKPQDAVLRDVVDQVQLSPDGKHLLVRKVESREGDYILEIYATDDLSKPLRRLNAGTSGS